MSVSTIALPLAFLSMAACVMWVVAKSKGPWWARASLVILTTILSVSMWSSLGELEGWPASGPPEKDLELHAAIVMEPQGEKPGSIYIWVTPPRDSDRSVTWMARFQRAPQGEPRAYWIPYSRKTHEAIEKVRKDLRRGRRVMIRLRKRDGKKRAGKKERQGANNLYDADIWYPLPSGSWGKPER